MGSRVSLSPPNLISVESADIVAGRYAYTRDLLQLDRFTDTSNPPLWSVPPSCLMDRVHCCTPRSGVCFLCPDGIAVWLLDNLSVPLQSSTWNHPSACENEDRVRGYIAAEREAGCLVSPLCLLDLTGIHTSLIGLVPKSEPNQLHSHWKTQVVEDPEHN